MARVAMLAHVKESTVVEPPPLPSRTGARIPWTGGKIVSNKDEALRKFYERKLRKGGDALSPAQRRALEDSIAKLGEAAPEAHTHEASASRHHKSKHDVVHKTSAAPKRMGHRAKVKVSGKSGARKTTVVAVGNGRVVGPRKDHKASASRNPEVALEDKLGMSLDALVKRRAK